MCGDVFFRWYIFSSVWDGSYTSNDKVEATEGGDISWFRWAYDCMCRGQYEDAKEMLRKGLIDDRTITSDG